MSASGEINRLLIVDDEGIIADSLVTIFKSNGYDARAVYSAEQALELVKTWQPALAIVDVVLPGMTGIELAERLRAMIPPVIVILLSGRFSTDFLPGSSEAALPAPGILMKPVPVPILLETAARALAPG